MVPTADRAAVGMMLAGLGGTIDLIVPRGGKSLVGRVQQEARVPVFAHLEGICHIYVDKAADLAMAVDIVTNAKMRRTGVCGAAECLLIHEDVVKSHRAGHHRGAAVDAAARFAPMHAIARQVKRRDAGHRGRLGP